MLLRDLVPIRGSDGTATTVPLRRERGPRLGAYVVLGLAGIVLGLAASRVELVVLGAPFLVLAVLATAPAADPQLRIRVLPPLGRLVEGDRLAVVVELVASRPVVVEVAARVRGPVRLDDPEGPVAVARRVGPEPVRWTIAPQTRHWGEVWVDRVELRVDGPGGLVRWTGGAVLRRRVEVLPAAPRGRCALRATQPRSVAGSHLTRLRGDGSDFAELRPHQPGDPLHAVNWKATARRGRLMANQRHSERAGDVVLVIDTTVDGGAYPPSSLLEAGRVAWALADLHLARQDRVGAVLFGSGLRWLPPRGGTRGREHLLQELFAVASLTLTHPSLIGFLPPHAIPAGATVVAITTLEGDVFATAVASLRRRGLDVAVVVVDRTPLLAPHLAPVPTEAVRLWRLEVEQRRRRLAAQGLRTVTLPAGASPDAAVLGLTGSIRTAPVTR